MTLGKVWFGLGVSTGDGADGGAIEMMQCAGTYGDVVSRAVHGG